MPPWHYDLHLVPERSPCVPQGAFPAIVDGFELARAWSGIPTPADWVERLHAILPERTPSRRSPRAWGRPEGDGIEVWTDAERITRVRIRIDVQALATVFLKDVLLLATEWSCLFYAAEAALLFRPEAEALLHRLRECDARVFLQERRRRRGS